MAKIYWFTGQAGSHRSELSEQLTEFLKTERRNWRRDVYYIDAEFLEEVSPYTNLLEEDNPEIVKNAQLISSFLQKNKTDVVVSLITPHRNQREVFKKEQKNNIVEIFVRCEDKKSKNCINFYEPPLDNFIEIDTTGKETIDSYADLIVKLRSQRLL